VIATRNKFRFRELVSRAGVLSPRYELLAIDENPEIAPPRIGFPCVLKPLALSGSRGVIRANDLGQFVAAFHRMITILRQPDAVARGKEEARFILVEEFIPGKEVVLEGIISKGKVKVLAIFDKPDPLDGPYFEETIYVTPSRLPKSVQEEIKVTATHTLEAIGLKEGPLHAEFRINEKGVWPLEVATRSIGGHCSQALRFETGLSLEEVILRHAIGADIATLEREKSASGVMMIPIPRAGILKEVRGLKEAHGVPSIEEIKISLGTGQL
jgi:biotin carboxylase